MYLIHISEPEAGSSVLKISLEYHVGEVPPYAILSHRWGSPADEVAFADMMGDIRLARKKKGYSKVENCCLQALEYGLNYAWIDTCCIDKSSSAELSEAINSMWSWYRQSKVCFAYLEDVLYESLASLSADGSAFRQSSWFCRGWTLQELIAPHDVIFFPKDWGPRPLGDKVGLADSISSITGIRRSVLQDRSELQATSIAERMSWASRRETTRVEDEAYSLMGLFGVNMATIYGEGRKAFVRLQEEIMRTSTDQTIFAWSGRGGSFGMFATSPRNFRDSSRYVPMEYNDFSKRFGFGFSEDTSSGTSDNTGTVAQPAMMTYSMTNFGLQISLPVAQMPGKFQGYHFAFIACTHGTDGDSTIIFLKQRQGRPRHHFHRVSFGGIAVIHRPLPRFQPHTNFSTQLLFISEDYLSYGLDLKPFLDEEPARRLVTLRIESSNYFVHDHYSRGPCETGSRSLCFRIGPSEHVAIIFGSKDNNRRLGPAFAFGVHNGQVWYSLKSGALFKPANEIHEDYDMFNCGQGWNRPEDRIKLLGDTSQRKWRVEGHYAQLFQNLTPIVTNNGEIIEEFDIFFFS